jgi:hypothetical protein
LIVDSGELTVDEEDDEEETGVASELVDGELSGGKLMG